MLRHRFAGRPRAVLAAELGAMSDAAQGDYELYAVVCHRGSLQASSCLLQALRFPFTVQGVRTSHSGCLPPWQPAGV